MPGCVELEICPCGGPHSWLVPAMLSPPESLLMSCIRRGNFMEAHQVCHSNIYASYHHVQNKLCVHSALLLVDKGTAKLTSVGFATCRCLRCLIWRHQPVQVN